MKLRFCLLWLLILPIAHAAPWTVSVRIAEFPEMRLEVTDLRVGSFDANLTISAHRASTGVVPAAQARLRSTLGATVLGNAVLEGSLAWAGDGSGHGAITLRGSFGPVAARGTFALMHSSHAPQPSAPWGFAASALGVWSDFGRAAPPSNAGWSWAFVGEAGYRIDRNNLLQIDAIYQHDHALAQRLSLRRTGVGPQLDAALAFELGRSLQGGVAALGVTGHHVPRRAPASSATLWLGVNDRGAMALSPAFTLRRTLAGGGLEIFAVAQGYGLESALARAGVQWSGPAPSGWLQDSDRITLAVGWRADRGLYASFSLQTDWRR